MGLAAAPVMGAEEVAQGTVAVGESAYRSAFAGYRRYSDQPVASWTASNDVVGRVGGWQAYAREAQAATGQTGSNAQRPQKPEAPATGGAGHSTHH